MRGSDGRSARQTSFMCAEAGGHRLVFDLRTLLSIEGQARVDHDAILGPVDLRAWLGIQPEDEGESLLVLGEFAVYRFVVDHVTSLARGELKNIFPIPRILVPLTERLCLRGVVELDEGLAFLVDPKPLAAAAGYEG